MVKVEYQYKTATKTGNIVAKVRMHPDDDEGRVITIATGVKLDQEFSYLIHLSPGGALGISAARYQWDAEITETWRDKPLYFKAGVYVQDNTGYTSEGGKVRSASWILITTSNHPPPGRSASRQNTSSPVAAVEQREAASEDEVLAIPVNPPRLNEHVA